MEPNGLGPEGRGQERSRQGRKDLPTSASTSRVSGTWYSMRWKPKAKGIYRCYVYAKDSAGNAQCRVGSAKITVN